MRPPRRAGPVALTASPQVIHLVTMPSRLKYMVLTNPTGNSINAIVAIVPAGAALAQLHHVLSNQPIPGNDNYTWPGTGTGDIPLDPGDSVQAQGDQLNLVVTIQENY